MSVAPTPLPRRPETTRPPAVILFTVLAFLAIAVLLAVVSHEHTFGSGTSTTLRGSGTSAVQTRAVPPFTSVNMGGTANAVVRVGSPQKVVVTADDNLLDHLQTTVRGGALTIATPGSFATVTPMQVVITLPHVDRLRLSGTGALEATGSTPVLSAILDGTGALRLSGLVARDVQATLSGTGAIEVTATRSLDAAVSGTGEITYNGFPQTVTQSITGAGAVVMGPR